MRRERSWKWLVAALVSLLSGLHAQDSSVGIGAGSAALPSDQDSGPTSDRTGADRPDLLEGVHRLHYPGLPGDLLALDSEVQVLVAGETRPGVRAPVALAREWGQGRVLLFSHDLFTKKSREQFDGERFLHNCLNWLGRSDKPSVALPPRARELGAHLSKLGCRVTYMRRNRLPKAGVAKIWMLPMSAFDRSAEDRAKIVAHLEGGGGLLCHGPGWGWKQLHPGQDLATDNGLNQVLGTKGMMIGRGTVKLGAAIRPKSRKSPKKDAAESKVTVSTVRGPGFAVVRLDSRPFTLQGALEILEDEKSDRADRKQAAATLVSILSVLPLDHATLRPLLPRLHALSTGKRRPHAERVAKTLEIEEDGERSIAGLQAGESLGLPVPDFPGPCPVPEQPGRDVVEVGLVQAGWASTGLYVPPGRVVEVERIRAPESREPDLMLQIGCHKDRLWHKDRWKRDPEITRSFALTAKTLIWSRHGGLLYLVSKKPVEPLQLRITGCVRAPRFVLGKDDAETWKRARSLTAPWGEIEGRRIIFALPTQVLATVEDPTPILEFWDSVVDCYETLDPQPPRPRKQRVVSDRQISAGYMHAGYPIMTWMDAPPKIVDLGWVHDRKGGGPWGLFHEIGHNYQQRAWTFGGTGEVTNNVFVLYGYEKLLGRKSLDTAMRRKMPERARKHLAAGAPFARWKSSPFLALEMYRQLSVGFGWEVIRKAFASYRETPVAARASDQVKRDEWLLRTSRAAGRDLGPFFERWGVPVTPEARAALSGLEPWSGPGKD